MKVLAAILLGLVVISLVTEDSEAGRRCGGPDKPPCPSYFTGRGRDAVQEPDQVPFKDAINFLREIGEEKW